MQCHDKQVMSDKEAQQAHHMTWRRDDVRKGRMRCGKGDTTGARCRRGEKEGCARGNTLSERTSGDALSGHARGGALRGARKGGRIEGDAGKREESAQRMKKKERKRKRRTS